MLPGTAGWATPFYVQGRWRVTPWAPRACRPPPPWWGVVRAPGQDSTLTTGTPADAQLRKQRGWSHHFYFIRHFNLPTVGIKKVKLKPPTLTNIVSMSCVNYTDLWERTARGRWIRRRLLIGQMCRPFRAITKYLSLDGEPMLRVMRSTGTVVPTISSGHEIPLWTMKHSCGSWAVPVN